VCGGGDIENSREWKPNESVNCNPPAIREHQQQLNQYNKLNNSETENVIKQSLNFKSSNDRHY